MENPKQRVSVVTKRSLQGLLGFISPYKKEPTLTNPYHDPVADFLADFCSGLTFEEARKINRLSRPVAEGVLRLALQTKKRGK